MDVALPEQIVCEDGVAITVGTGFTVTVTVIGVPGHPPAVGVMVYTAVPAAVPVVLIVCTMLEPEPDVAPVTPLCDTVQLYVVPVTLLVSEIDVALPEQIVADEGVAVTVGFGFTVTVTEIGVPVQPFAVGVTV